MSHLEKFEKLALLGITLSVKTSLGDSFTGELFFYNSETKILILKERIFESKKYNYRYLNTDYLTEFKILSIKDVSQIEFELPDVDFETILRQETQNKTENDEEEKMKYGQYLYDKLQNEGHYKVRWDLKTIVLEELKISIKFPYSLEDISLNENGKESLLKNIKKQVENLSKKYKSQ